MASQSKNVWFVLTLSMLAALSATTVDLFLPAQPTIAAQFGAPPAAGGIIVSAYFAGYGPGQLVWGPVADRFGRMGPLFVGLVGFTALTVACPFAGSLDVLALLRGAQGAFGASGPVIARAIARDQGGGKRTARLLATIAIIFGAAPLLAPLVGSGILVLASWPALFWLLAAFSLVLGAAVVIFVRPHAGGVSSEPVPVGAYLRAGLHLFVERDFVMGGAVVSAVFLGYATLLSTGAAMVETHYGIPAQGFGLLFAVSASAVVLGPWLGRRLLRKRSPRDALWVGAAICGVASASLLAMVGTFSLGWASPVPLPALWAAVFAYVFGMGMIFPLANALALEPAGSSAGLASSLLGGLSMVAGATSAGLAASGMFSTAYEAIGLSMGASGVLCLGLVVLWTRWHTRAHATSGAPLE